MLQNISHSLSGIQQAEYVIYGYDHDDEQSSERWKRIKSGHDPSQIKQMARDLFQSRNYKKIEIQKKYFDKKRGHHRVATFHVFETKQQLDYFVFSSVLLLSLASVGLFYLKMM